MDNNTRSERSRNAILQAALAIIARDGPGQFTLDAIARESGISKGGVLHHFRTKEAVLTALLDHQIGYFEAFSRDYIAEHGSSHAQPQLAAQVATLRETIAQPHSVFLAVLGAVARDPALLAASRDISGTTLERIKAEAPDPDLATLRWLAAQGLALTTLLSMCPLDEQEQGRLFDRLLDDRQWSGASDALQ